MVIGIGQCGGKIADEFARLGIRARVQRRINIITGALAVNTDIADLSGLSTIKSDYRHRILIGAQKTGGHGVGKINELGAEIAKEDTDKIIDAIRATEMLPETDAFLLIAGAAGGTGSGSIAIITQQLRERYEAKPIYNLIALPFHHEEEIEGRTIYNSATCLKSAYLVSDAIFLLDNQRYVKKDSSIVNNLATINAMIAEPFYNILCAGEEKKAKYIGSRMLDAGDIIQTLEGWTVIGHGKSQLPLMRPLFEKKSGFAEKATETHKGIQAMNAAISELSLQCNPADANKGLYLLSGPEKELDMNLVKEIGSYIKGIAPEAVIRTGDYPREKSSVQVSLILSGLRGVRKVTDYFTKTIDYISAAKNRKEGIDYDDEQTFKDIPMLL